MPLKQKLGRLKRERNDMGTLMAALVKYADSNSTKDPESDDDKAGKGKKNDNGKGPQHNPANQGGNKRKVTVVWISWLTLVRRVTTNGAKGGHLPIWRVRPHT